MTKEQQDLAWACLPKEERNKIISVYACNRTSGNQYNMGYSDALRKLYGEHNLTSDTEPEEMLMVERKVQEMFDIGQKVRAKGTKQIGTIKEPYSNDIDYRVYFEDGDGGWNKEYSANDLEPYTEENKEPMEVKFNLGDKVEVDDEDDERIYTVIDILEIEGKILYKLHHGESKERIEMAHLLKHYIKPKNMETKELNLCELLKGCEGDKFYSRAYGVVFLNEIVCDNRPNAQEIKLYTPEPQSDRLWFLRNGKKHANGEIDLYPSCALYEKYPLDAYSAWMEWKESRTPKQWEPKIGEEYYSLSGALNVIKLNYFDNEIDKVLSEAYNKFPTSEIAQQAAEVVRECLKKFHEQKDLQLPSL